MHSPAPAVAFASSSLMSSAPVSPSMLPAGGTQGEGYFLNRGLWLSKEVGKQYFRVTNDFYLMELTMMKGGARVRLDLDEGWCETLHYITIHQKRIDFDEGWCETLHYI